MARLLLLALMLAFGMPAAVAQEPLSPLARSIESDLDRLESPPVDGRPRLESDRLRRTPDDRRGPAVAPAPSDLRSAQEIGRSSELGAARQDLQTLKTREPDAGSIPLLERQLDRVERGGGGTLLYQPSRNPAAIYSR